MSKLTCSKCHRDCRKEVYFGGYWRRMCRYHIVAYYDLPHRDLIV